MAQQYLDKSGLTYLWGKIKTYVTNAIKVTGVKGDSESSYRTGNINITKTNIGLGNVDNTADANKNVATAVTFTSAKSVTLTGDVTGSASSTGGWSISTTVGDDSHNHTANTIMVPMATKTYTGVIATSNDQATGNLYCIRVIPTSYASQWSIKYRVYSTMNGVSAANGSGIQESFVYIVGTRNSYVSYRIWNNVNI